MTTAAVSIAIASWPVIGVRVGLVAAGIALWYWTQAVLGKRVPKVENETPLTDGIRQTAFCDAEGQPTHGVKGWTDSDHFKTARKAAAKAAKRDGIPVVIFRVREDGLATGTTIIDPDGTRRSGQPRS